MELPKNIELLIFDFDGTLFDLDVDWEAVRHDLGIGYADEKIGDAMQRFQSEGNVLIEKLTEHELAALKKGRFSPDVLTTLGVLAERYKLAVCSRNAHVVLEQAFADTSVADKLYIVGREDVDRHKPDPEGIHTILQHYGLQPNRAALIGDTYHDVQAARAAGVMAIVVRNPKLAYQPEGADSYIVTIADLR